MRIRNVLQEFEAHLVPTQGSRQTKAYGKAEWKTYADGTRQCKVSLSRLDLSDGTTLALVVAGRRITELTVQHGAIRYRRETERGEQVATVAENEILQVLDAGQVILEGRFISE